MAKNLPRYVIVCALMCWSAPLGCAKSGSEEERGTDKRPLVVPPSVLAKEYLEGQNQAHTKYNGKVIETTGTVRMSPGLGEVTLRGIDRANLENGFNVICAVPAEQQEKAARFSAGQAIKVVGIADGNSWGQPRLKDCVFTEIEPSNILVMTLADYLKKRGALEKEAKEGRFPDAILTGTVAEVGIVKEDVPTILPPSVIALKGFIRFRERADNVRVTAGILESEVPLLKAGQTIEFRASLGSTLCTAEECQIHIGCFMPSTGIVRNRFLFR